MNGEPPICALLFARVAPPEPRLRKRNQVGHLPAIERQLENALVLHHLTDARGPGFHQRGAGLDLHRLRKLTKLQDDVDHGTAVDLQHDAGLRMRPEPDNVASNRYGPMGRFGST